MVLKSPLRSLRDILSPRFAAGRGKRPLQGRTMVSTNQQSFPRSFGGLATPDAFAKSASHDSLALE